MTLCCISTFIPFLMGDVIHLDTKVRLDITCPGCAKTEMRNSQRATWCCSWQCSVCMKDLRCFCFECKLGQLPRLSPDTTARFCCCSLLLCRSSSFTYQGGGGQDCYLRQRRGHPYPTLALTLTATDPDFC